MSFFADDETEGGIIIKKDTFYVVALNVLSYLLVRNKIYVPVMITEKKAIIVFHVITEFTVVQKPTLLVSHYKFFYYFNRSNFVSLYFTLMVLLRRVLVEGGWQVFFVRLQEAGVAKL